MKCIRHSRSMMCGILTAALMAAAPTAFAAVIVFDDSWTDGERTDGADATDIDWWTSASSNGIEASVGSMGMVTGTSGRGIHTVFPTKKLNDIGDKIIATYTFTTPTTIGTGTAGFRAGLFDHLGRAGLKADVAASSGSPNALFGWGTGASPAGPGTAGLPGYMLDMDVGTTLASNDLSFREHDPGTVVPTGRLMGTTTGFTQLSPTGPDGVFAFAPNTTYTGSLSIERVSATEMEITGTLGSASHSVVDVFDSDRVGMLAFWANSNLFGTSGTPNTPDNGIDFSNINVVFIPEPASLLMLVSSSVLLVGCRRGARQRG